MKIRTELNFPTELKEKPIICNLCKKFDIILNILEASFSTEVGWAILILEGSEKVIKDAIVFLKNAGVEIKNIEEQQT